MLFSACSLYSDQFDPSSPVSTITREEGSGTRGAFVELMGLEIKDEKGVKWDITTEEALVTNSTSNVMLTVSLNPHAVGYISLGSMSPMVKAIAIDGVEASAATIKSGDYPVARPFNIVTDSKSLSPVAEDFITYIMSAEGQAVAELAGYVSVNDGSVRYASSGLSGKIVVGGSSSVTPVMEKLKEGYLALNPKVEIEVQQSDSSTGVSSVVEGILDIGMASRPLKESELAKGVTPTVIALDGIAVIVNVNNPHDSLTMEQVTLIYKSDYITWAEVTE